MVTQPGLLMIRGLAHRGHSYGTGFDSRLVVSRFRESEVFPKVVSRVEVNAHTLMLKTRLYVECPNCQMQYLMKDFGLTYSNGAYIENVAGAPEWQRLLCPCRPQNPHKFKLCETTRLHMFSVDESERTHFLPPKNKLPIRVSARLG
jgi:hypothetical protein